MKSKTGAKAIAAADKAAKVHAPRPKAVSKPMRKLLDKNERKAKARVARQGVRFPPFVSLTEPNPTGGPLI